MLRKPLSLTQEFNRVDFQPPGWREDYFTNQYDNRMRYGFAPATTAEKKGTVVLTHGYGEFIELYYLAIKEYQKMGFDVWAMDFYGFGKSDRDNPDRPNVPSTKGMLRHVNDLDFFTKNIVQRVPDRPLLMSTHSMGGHIGLMHLQKHPGVFDGAVMSAPMFDVYRFGLPSFVRPVMRTIFNIASALGLRDTSVPVTTTLWSKILTATDSLKNSTNGGLREAFNVMMREAVPDARVNRPSFGWVSTAYNTIARSTTDEALRSVKVPILIGSAGLENLVDNNTLNRAARLMKQATLVKLPTAHHGIWFENDKNHDQWLKNVQAFARRIAANYGLAQPVGSETAIAAAQTPDPHKIRSAFGIPPEFAPV